MIKKGKLIVKGFKISTEKDGQITPIENDYYEANNHNSTNNNSDNDEGNEYSSSSNKKQEVKKSRSYTKDDKYLVDKIEADIIDHNVGVSFDDIVGLDEAKRILKETVIVPVLMPSFFTGIMQPWNGILLHGPPGTGKTMLAKAVANQTSTTFFNVSSSTLVSKWRGESEKLMRVLYNMACHYAPSIIFFDEIDALCSKRGSSNEHEASRRMKSELFALMDGIQTSQDKRVIVLATTNRPWDLDEALLRRLEKRVYVAMPTDQARVNMFEKHLKDCKIAEDIDYEEFASMTINYSGADIRNVCRDAAMAPMRRLIDGKSASELKEIQSNVDSIKSSSTFELKRDDVIKSINRIKKVLILVN